MDKNQKEESFEYKLGRRVGVILAYVIAGCVTSVAVGLTIKFLQWLLF